jgi:hypothetical protein
MLSSFFLYFLGFMRWKIVEYQANSVLEAANHIEDVESLLLAYYPLTRVQFDAVLTYLGHKGEKADIPKGLIRAVSGEALQ